MKKTLPFACVVILFLSFWVASVAAQTPRGRVPDTHPQDSPPEVPQDYIIGQGDQLEVFVWRNEQLSRQVLVMPDGKISLPRIQQVQAAGLSIAEVRDRITGKLRTYVVNPRVTVIVTQLNSYRVSVLGNVVRPGVYPITGKTTVIEAISMAGGLTEWAKKRGITVIRNQNSREERIKVNYNKVVSGKDLSQNIVLERGDTIIVP